MQGQAPACVLKRFGAQASACPNKQRGSGLDI